MDLDFKALIQSLAVHAQNTRNFQEAAHLFERFATSGKNHGDAKIEAIAYHQLGMIAQEQRDFASAEQWYRKSLAINEKQGNEHGAALTYHQLGRIAGEQRDFAGAEQWHRKALAIKEKQGDEHGAAITYHEPGDERPGAARLRGCGAVVPQGAGDRGEAGRRARRGDHL